MDKQTCFDEENYIEDDIYCFDQEYDDFKTHILRKNKRKLTESDDSDDGSDNNGDSDNGGDGECELIYPYTHNKDSKNKDESTRRDDEDTKKSEQIQQQLQSLQLRLQRVQPVNQEPRECDEEDENDYGLEL